MLVLDSDTKTLTVGLDEAIVTTQPTWLVSFEETPSKVLKSAQGLLNGTTPVEIIQRVATQTVAQRSVQFVSIHNKDSIRHGVSVLQKDSAGTDVEVRNGSLEVNERLVYTADGLWRVYDARGDLKNPVGLMTEKVLGQVRAGNDSNFLLYRPGANTKAVVLSLTISNVTATKALYRVMLDPVGTIASEQTSLAWDIEIEGNNTIIMEGRWPMADPNSSLTVRSSVGNALTFTAGGEETKV